MSQCLVLVVVLKVTAKDALVSSDAISQNPSQKGTASPHEMTMGYEGLLDLLIWLGF